MTVFYYVGPFDNRLYLQASSVRGSVLEQREADRNNKEAATCCREKAKEIAGEEVERAVR